MTLTKDAIISAVAEANGYPRTQAVELVETLIGIIKSNLASGEDVLISSFGKFCVKEKRERRGRNPATGEDMMLAKRRVVTFKWSGRLRDKINGSKKGLKLDHRRRGYGEKISNPDNR
jgi:integration host factor subunit alpha